MASRRLLSNSSLVWLSHLLPSLLCHCFYGYFLCAPTGQLAGKWWWEGSTGPGERTPPVRDASWTSRWSLGVLGGDQVKRPNVEPCAGMWDGLFTPLGPSLQTTERVHIHLHNSVKLLICCKVRGRARRWGGSGLCGFYTNTGSCKTTVELLIDSCVT